LPLGAVRRLRGCRDRRRRARGGRTRGWRGAAGHEADTEENRCHDGDALECQHSASTPLLLTLAFHCILCAGQYVAHWMSYNRSTEGWQVLWLKRSPTALPSIPTLWLVSL